MLSMRPPGFSDAVRMSFVEFARRIEPLPEHEKWELVEGYPVPMMNPPATRHQRILHNLQVLLERLQPADASWEVLPGLGLNLAEADDNAAIPDVIVKRPPWPTNKWVRDPLAIFEILSPSTRGNDLGWKRDFYTRFPTLAHYVVIEQNAVRVRVASRADNWSWRDVPGVDARVDLDALGIALSLAELYRKTDFV